MRSSAVSNFLAIFTDTVLVALASLFGWHLYRT